MQKKTLFYNMSFKKISTFNNRSQVLQTCTDVNKISKVKRTADDTDLMFSWKNKNQ